MPIVKGTAGSAASSSQINGRTRMRRLVITIFSRIVRTVWSICDFDDTKLLHRPNESLSPVDVALLADFCTLPLGSLGSSMLVPSGVVGEGCLLDLEDNLLLDLMTFFNYSRFRHGTLTTARKAHIPDREFYYTLGEDIARPKNIFASASASADIAGALW